MGRKPNEGVEKIKTGDCKAKEREKVNANTTQKPQNQPPLPHAVTKPGGFCPLQSPDPQGLLFIFTAMLGSDFHDLAPSHALCLHSHALQIYLLYLHHSDLLKREL